MQLEHEGARGASFGVLDQAKLSLALDFANTADWHAGPDPEERLTGYQTVLDWARDKGILDEADAAGLAALAEDHPAEQREALERAIALREAVYHIFSAVAAGGAPDAADVEVLRAELGEALVHLRLTVAPGGTPSPDGSPLPGGALSPDAESSDEPAGAGAARPGVQGQRFVWVWAGMSDHLTSVLWPIARSAASLLTSPQLTRVRECAGHPCGWLFLDHSKNGSRRWCDMADCGNRAKARRYRARKKEGTASGPATQGSN
jgi:predicted RNA-binding Zn ribbon-like protein